MAKSVMGADVRAGRKPGYRRLPRDSRSAIQTVAEQITTPPTSVERLGISVNTSQPMTDAHTRSRNLTDWVDEMSVIAKARVTQ